MRNTTIRQLWEQTHNHILLWTIPRKNRWKLASFRKPSQTSDQCWQYPKCQPTTVSSTSRTWPSPTFRRTLPQATSDFDTAIMALRKHYCNPNVRELHNLQLHNLNFDHKNGSPEVFLVQVQIKATQAYPDSFFPPIPPANPPNAQAEINRVQNAQDANQAVLDNPVNERNRRDKEIFKNAMPNFIKRKLLDQNEAATVQDLCFCKTPNRILQFLPKWRLDEKCLQ